MSAPDVASRAERAAPGAPRVSIIVMAYNEAQSLASVVDEIGQTMADARISYEMVIVDDGSRDGMGAVADELASSRANVRVIHHPVNRGIGEVYRSGFGAAGGELLTFLPADGQFPATIVADFVPRMDSADLVLGYITDINRGWLGEILSFGERILYRLMFGRMPKFQGIMMFRRELLRTLDVRLGGRGWGVLMEIIVRAKRAGLRIASVPTALRPRMSGSSKVANLRSVWANLKQAVALWWRL